MARARTGSGLLVSTDATHRIFGYCSDQEIDPQMSSFQHAEHGPQSSAYKVGPPRERRSSSNLAGPPLALSQYPSANYTAPQLQQYSKFSGHFQPHYLQQSFPRALQNLQSPVQQQPVTNSGQNAFSPAITQSGQFNIPTSRQEADLGDNSDGGVALPPSY